MTSTYWPGTSPLHRCGAGAKLLALAVGMSLLAWRQSVPAVLTAAVLVAAAVCLARLPWRVVGGQIRPLRWILPVLVAFQWLTQDWQAAVVVSGTLVVAVAAAAVVTATTRMQDMLDALQRLLHPLRRLGVDPERVGLLLALTLRAVPVLQATIGEVADARKARGLQRSTRALLVPLLVRTVRHADHLAEALAARGVDD